MEKCGNREKKGRAFSINPHPTFISRGELRVSFCWILIVKFYQVSLDEGIGRNVEESLFFIFLFFFFFLFEKLLKIFLSIKGETVSKENEEYGMETLEMFLFFLSG